MPDKANPGERSNEPKLVMVAAVRFVNWKFMDPPKPIDRSANTGN
ncbi:hypothetical protein JCM19235_4329 [Vibrio maritimus]|uniref:Uncharacterized protein n=1 Tax=Vibrio maritimus TaxID=990268 RepID=A0A090S0W6_9VIBR|nr:hypothetical protein JCM19235_4329 [Vibrio maritimus]